MSPPSLTAAGEPARPTIIVGAFSAGSVSSPAPVSDRDHDLRRSRRLTSRAVPAAQGRTGLEFGSRNPQEEHSIGTQLLRGE